MNPNVLLNWWANESITLPASACPAAPGGTPQVTDAFVLSSDQGTVYLAAFVATLVVVMLGVLVTYQTRKLGDLFARRWKISWLVTSLLAAAACTAVVLLMPVTTFGCEYGNVTTRIPTVEALERASVALVQALVGFVAFSLMLTRLSRVTRFQPWFNNSRYPF